MGLYDNKHKIKEDVQTHLGMLYKDDIIYIQDDRDDNAVMVTDLTGRIYYIPKEYIDYDEISD